MPPEPAAEVNDDFVPPHGTKSSFEENCPACGHKSSFAAPFAPGIFTYVASDKKVYAVLQRVSDGTYITPENPAHPGDSLRMFVTGLGNTTPVGGTNELGLPGQMITAPVIVGVNNLGVPVGPVQALEGAIGVYSVQFDVPKDAQPGPYQNLGFAVIGADNNPVYAYGSFLPVQ